MCHERVNSAELSSHFLRSFVVNTAVQEFTGHNFSCKLMFRITRHETGILKLQYDNLIIFKYFVLQDDIAPFIIIHVGRRVPDLQHCI